MRGLDARSRSEIEAAGTLSTLEAGEALFRRGEPADAFFVVVDGVVEVRAARTRDSEARVIRRATAGDALGEEATMRMGASRAMDAVCRERARVASVPMAVFRRATGRAGGGEIMSRVERTLRRAAGHSVTTTRIMDRLQAAPEVSSSSWAAAASAKSWLKLCCSCALTASVCTP